jgi:hypothetical protein
MMIVNGIIHGIIAPALIATMTVTAVVKMETMPAAPVEPMVQILPLKLYDPDVEWVQNKCQANVDWCLGGSNYIKHQMYIQGLKHIQAECLGKDNPLYAKK